MKRNFTFLMTAFALMVGMMMPLGMKGQTRTTVADQMMASDLAATSTTYTDFSGVTLNSDAVYAGQSAMDASGNIQLRSKNSNSGIVSTTSGGKIKSVKITVASENSNTIDVYGSNTAYTSVANLYSTSGNNNQGTKLGSLTSTGTITVTGDYAYVGVRSNSGAVYISSIEFTWESTGGGTPTPTPCTVTFNPGNGTCDTPSVTEDSGTSITLPTATPSTTCADAGWTFAGWAISNVDFTTMAPTLLTGSYTINGDATLYAVYSMGEAFNNSGSGDFIIYAAAENTNYYANGTISNSKIGSTTSASEAAVYTFEKPSGYGDGEYAIKIGTKYIKYTSSTNLGTSNDPYKWAITAAGTHGTWRVTASTDDTRALIFRTKDSSNQYYLFGCYKATNVNGTEYFDLEIGGEGEFTYATSPDCTDITVSESSLSFLYEGGTSSFDFTINNPVDGAITTATSTNDWITNVAVSDNTVNFQVAQNDGLARSGEITLTYAKNGITLATATVTINQDSNPVLPGGADNPYTVAQAVDATPSSGTSGFVYVRGIVSEIIEIEVMQYHNARYYISDDGSTSSPQLLAFYGRNINNTDFLSEDELLVGDEVVVYGQLKKYNDTEELDRGNYIVSLTRAVQPVTFNPGSCVSPSSVGVNLFTESIFDYDGTKIYYTTNGGDPREVGIAFEDAGDANLELTQTTTLKAAALVPELGKWSAVTEATYTIVPEGSGGWQGQPYTVSEALAALDQNSDIKGAYVQGIVSRVSQIDTTLYYNATYYISDNGEENNELYVFRGKYISRADFTSTDQLKPGDQVTVYGDLTIYGNTNPVKEFKPKNYIENWYRPASIMITPDQFEFSSNATSGVIDVIYSSDILVNAYNPTVQFCDADGETATYNWLTVTPSQANDWDLEFIIDANEGDQPRTAYLRVLGRDNQSNDIESNIISITQSEFKVDFATLDFYFNGGHNDIADTPGLTGAYLGTYAAENTRLKFVNPSADQISMLVLKINEVPGVLTYDIKGNGMEGGTFKVQESSNGLTYSDVASYSGLANNLQSVTIDNLSTSTRYIRWIYVTKNKGNVGVGNIHLYKPIVNYDLVVNNPMDGDTQIGAISANPAGPSIPAGADVALSISYDINSYYFVEWVVTDDSDNPVTVTGSHFTMPAANVTVTATLVSVNTPCAYAFSVNGQMGDQQSGTVGNTIQMPECSNINFNGQTFIFLGWTTNANDIGNLLAVGSSFTLNQDVTFHAVFRQQVSGLEAEKHFAKVTRELQDWSGDYLIVYEDEDVAFNGSLQTLDAASNTVEVTISNGIIIASSDEVNSAKFTIAAVEGGYSIKSASGKYIGKDDNDNGMDESTEYDENYVNEISYNEEEGEIDIVGSGGAHLRFNSASNQNRFRYYKSSTYTVQEGIQLYKYVGSVSNLYTRIFMNETASSVTIEGPSLIPEGSVLNATTLSNTLGADRLVVAEGAQLVTSSNVDATIMKAITAYQSTTDNYYLISTPVDGQDPTEANMTDGAFDLYSFDQTQQGKEWQNYEANAFALQSGKGYLYANEYGGNIVMAGQMNGAANGVTISQASGKPFAGWNLIGNPYPCNVTINKPFYRLAEGGAVLATEATDNTVAIAPMEGVFVCADRTETVSFTKAPTTSTTGGRNLLSMRVSRNRSSKDDRVDTDNAIVRFGEGDMLRKLVLNPDLSQLYVAQDGTDYAIVNAEAEGELPVSFRAATNGSYTFSMAMEEVEMNYLHLIDHKTGADVDLLQTPSYTFEASTADYECRFTLVFARGASTTDDTFAYYNGSQWVVSSEADATLQVVDMMGRVLSSQSINGDAEVSIDRAAGVYLLRLINGSDVKVQKIVIH